MTDTAHQTEVPSEWLDILEESEADLAAGRIVPGDVVISDLRDDFARLGAREPASPKSVDIAAIERWLRNEVVAGHQEYLAAPVNGVSADKVLGRLQT